MQTHLVLEALYPEMEEATIGQWLAAPGAVIDAGQPLAELITDKVAYEYQSPAAGALLTQLVAEKSVVPVGTVLGILGAPGETVADRDLLEANNLQLALARESSLASMQLASGNEDTAPTEFRVSTAAVRATPAARRLARERGVDLAGLTGTGPGGMISVDDIPGA